MGLFSADLLDVCIQKAKAFAKGVDPLDPQPEGVTLPPEFLNLEHCRNRVRLWVKHLQGVPIRSAAGGLGQVCVTTLCLATIHHVGPAWPCPNVAFGLFLAAEKSVLSNPVFVLRVPILGLLF